MKRLLFAIAFTTFFAVVIAAQGTSTASATTSGSASTGSTAKKPPVFRANKDQIKQVQTMLKEKKLYTGDATGKLNDDTRAAIKSFQKASGIKETGTLNRVTLEKFGVQLTDTQKAIPASSSSKSSGPSDPNTAATSSSGDKPKKPAPFRANADQIKAAQKMLKDGKMYTGDETGKLDDATRAALKKYQESNGLKSTGTLNADTLTKMGIALTDAQKASVAASKK